MTVKRAFQRINPTFRQGRLCRSAGAGVGDVHLGNDCSVWPGTIIRGDVHRIRIGERTTFRMGSVLHVTPPGSLPRRLPAYFRLK